MDTALLPSATLAEFYRFALLLTGESVDAEQVTAETLAEVEAQLGSFRQARNRHAWLAQRIRERCVKMYSAASIEAPARDGTRNGGFASSRLSEMDPYVVAQQFHTLPEPERSALALFYLDLFAPDEVAQMMNMSLEQLAETLERARTRLKDALQGVHPS